MKLTRSALIFGAVLLVSAGVSYYGYTLALDAARHLSRSEWHRAMLFLFGGMTVVPIVLFILVNRLIPGEAKQLGESVSRKRSPSYQVRIRKHENMIRQLQFMKKYPSATLAFILVALVVSACMIFAPATSDMKPRQITELHVFGMIIGVGYLIGLVLFIYTRLFRDWRAYIDSSIAQQEKLIAELQAKQTDAIAGGRSMPFREPWATLFKAAGARIDTNRKPN